MTVSPVGLSTSGITSANNGANFGPDTTGTVTSGIQGAVNFAIAEALSSQATAPVIQLLGGRFTLSTFTNATYRMAVAIDSGYTASRRRRSPR